MCSEAHFAVTDQREKVTSFSPSTSDMNVKDTGLVFKLKKKLKKPQTTLQSQEQEYDKFLAGFSSTGGSTFKETQFMNV